MLELKAKEVGVQNYDSLPENVERRKSINEEALKKV